MDAWTDNEEEKWTNWIEKKGVCRRRGGGNEGGEGQGSAGESGEAKEAGMKRKIDKINVNDKEAASIGELKR